MADVVHWGWAGDGHLGLCGAADGARRTALRLVTCAHCHNRVDGLLTEIVPTPRRGERPVIPQVVVVTDGAF